MGSRLFQNQTRLQDVAASVQCETSLA